MITSRSNPLVKKARSLRQARARKDTGLFLIEGLQLIGMAFEAGWEIETLLHAPELLESDFGHNLIGNFGGHKEVLSKDVFVSISDKDNPQGLLAVAKQRHVAPESVVPSEFGVALCAAQDPGNVGSILRTLEAVHGQALFLLDGGVDPYHPSVIRASMGASFVIPVVQAGFSEFVPWCRAAGVQLIGTSTRAQKVFRDSAGRKPWILLMGSEQKGLTDHQKASCDIVVSIPMNGRISSLNLAVAAGVLLYWYTGASAPAARA